jgi:hypothetical protein
MTIFGAIVIIFCYMLFKWLFRIFFLVLIAALIQGKAAKIQGSLKENVKGGSKSENMSDLW